MWMNPKMTYNAAMIAEAAARYCRPGWTIENLEAEAKRLFATGSDFLGHAARKVAKRGCTHQYFVEDVSEFVEAGMEIELMGGNEYEEHYGEEGVGWGVVAGGVCVCLGGIWIIWRFFPAHVTHFCLREIRLRNYQPGFMARFQGRIHLPFGWGNARVVPPQPPNGNHIPLRLVQNSLNNHNPIRLAPRIPTRRNQRAGDGASSVRPPLAISVAGSYPQVETQSEADLAALVRAREFAAQNYGDRRVEEDHREEEDYREEEEFREEDRYERNRKLALMKITEERSEEQELTNATEKGGEGIGSIHTSMSSAVQGAKPKTYYYGRYTGDIAESVSFENFALETSDEVQDTNVDVNRAATVTPMGSLPDLAVASTSNMNLVRATSHDVPVLCMENESGLDNAANATARETASRNTNVGGMFGIPRTVLSFIGWNQPIHKVNKEGVDSSKIDSERGDAKFEDICSSDAEENVSKHEGGEENASVGDVYDASREMEPPSPSFSTPKWSGESDKYKTCKRGRSGAELVNKMDSSKIVNEEEMTGRSAVLARKKALSSVRGSKLFFSDEEEEEASVVEVFAKTQKGAKSVKVTRSKAVPIPSVPDVSRAKVKKRRPKEKPPAVPTRVSSRIAAGINEKEKK